MTGARYVLMTEYIVSLTVPELSDCIGSLESDRDRIIHAIDTLIAGV